MSGPQITIGIHVSGDSERLQRTLTALNANTREPHHVIILGDGVDTEALAAPRHIDQSNTSDRRGAPACFNRLAHQAEGDVFVFLENGAEPAPGWLERILAALRRDPRRGIAGPSTNRSWNQQCVLPARTTHSPDPTEMSRIVARRFGATCRTLEPLYSLSDFCYVVTRAALRATGDADENYAAGPCWEMDYNIRAQRAGYSGVWVCASYVHRAPISPGRFVDEQVYFEASKRRYQDKFCGLRLRGVKQTYREHCRGDACANFAPRDLIAIRLNSGPQPDAAATTGAPGSASPPLASCIMPTYDRRPFIWRAVECFLAQDYPNLELIVADDGTDAIEDLLPADSRIRYIRLAGKLTTGEKRNAACREARGEYILHWDDDDWYGPGRVSRQVAALQESNAQVCGSTALYFYAPSTNLAFRYHYRGAVAAWMGALAYPRRVWQSQPFEAIQVAEDVKFIGRIPAAARVDLNDPALSVATIHDGNTSPKLTAGPFWTPENPGTVLALMGFQKPYEAKSRPIVSCIMPTLNRRPFIPLTLACFRAQTWAAKELIVVDDGEDDIRDLVAGVPQVRYLRLSRRATIGAKRNAACEEARGDFIAHWDDDDWYSSARIAHQMEPLLVGTADLTGMKNSYILEMPAGHFWNTSAELHRRMFVGDVHGGTVVYPREIWNRLAKYPNVNLAEDAALIKQATWKGKRVQCVDNRGEFVYVRHARNTWQFESGHFLDPSGWRRIPAPPEFPGCLIEAYRSASDAIDPPVPVNPASLRRQDHAVVF
jgi:O-antigen biosynthesis protein